MLALCKKRTAHSIDLSFGQTICVNEQEYLIKWPWSVYCINFFFNCKSKENSYKKEGNKENKNRNFKFRPDTQNILMFPSFPCWLQICHSTHSPQNKFSSFVWGRIIGEAKPGGKFHQWWYSALLYILSKTYWFITIFMK